MKQTQRTEKKAEFLPSLLVMVAAILVLVGGILVLKLDPHIPLIMCTFVLVFYGLYLGISWSDMMSSAVKSISECIEAIIIMMSIGMVVGAWIAGGTVPFIIYWGLKIFSPQWLLPFTVVLCALMSTLIGSSWTTAGTIGVAFMGIGMGLGHRHFRRRPVQRRARHDHLQRARAADLHCGVCVHRHELLSRERGQRQRHCRDSGRP